MRIDRFWRSSLVAAAVALGGCNSGGGGPPEIKDNGTCVFSGAVNETHRCTVAGVYSGSTLSGAIVVQYNIDNLPDGGFPSGYEFIAQVNFPGDPTPGTYTYNPSTNSGNASFFEPTTQKFWEQSAYTLVLSTVKYLGDDPDIPGKVFLPTGTFTATMPANTGTGATGTVTANVTF